MMYRMATLLPLLLPLLLYLEKATARSTIETPLLPIHRQLLWEQEQLTNDRANISPNIKTPKRSNHPQARISKDAHRSIEEVDSSTVLRHPWWLELGEDGDPYVPLPRRGHSSTVHTVERSDSQPIEEYMITSGGFSDDDWAKFPVWSYNITSAVSENYGKWQKISEVGEDEICSNVNTTTDGTDQNDGRSLWDNAVNCAPQSRLGHISVVRNHYLHVFGGLLYNKKEGVFFMEEEPYIYRLSLLNRNSSWQRILPRVRVPPITPKGEDKENGIIKTENTINRGEVRGGYWQGEGKMVIYGGLHVKDYDSQYTGKLQQEDTTLGDVWAYDFKSETWETMSLFPETENTDQYPEARTSHAATIVGDELVICGGLKKVETLMRDGTTVWDQFDDVWIFDLINRIWTKRPMAQSIGRSQHSLVGWDHPNGLGPIIASFGGYKTVYDMARPVTYVFDDTLVSFPPSSGDSWLEVRQPDFPNSEYDVTISNRREHSAVLSSYGNMLVWGGRFETTSDAEGMWSLSIKSSVVEYTIAEDDDYNSRALEEFYLLVTTVMFISMMFTYMCGTLARLSSHEVNDGANSPIDHFSGFEDSPGMFGRSNGLSQDTIDTLPIKTYHNNDSPSTSSVVDRGHDIHPGAVGQEISNENSLIRERRTESSQDLDTEGDNCCPICLVEYKEGDELRSLPCGHDFHKSCVDSWLANNASCPACRYSLQNIELTANTSNVLSWARIPNISIMQSQSSEEGTEGEASQRISTHSTRRLPLIHFFRRPFSVARVSANLAIDSTPENSSGRHNNESADDIALSYSSSVELSGEISSRLGCGNGNNGSEFPIQGRPRRMRVGQQSRRMQVRRAGRRVSNDRTPLNNPLQPNLSASIV